MTAWVYLPNVAIYPDIPAYQPTWTLFVWSLIAGPLIGLAATGYIRLIGWISHHRVTGAPAGIAAPVVAFGLLGLIGIALSAAVRQRPRPGLHRVSRAWRRRDCC